MRICDRCGIVIPRPYIGRRYGKKRWRDDKYPDGMVFDPGGMHYEHYELCKACSTWYHNSDDDIYKKLHNAEREVRSRQTVVEAEHIQKKHPLQVSAPHQFHHDYGDTF